jgi:hypothetical protein
LDYSADLTPSSGGVLERAFSIEKRRTQMVRMIKSRLTRLALLATISATAYATARAIAAWKEGFSKASAEKMPQDSRKSYDRD